uniref:receptor protein-tyrosine kinase n=1 Tax=Ceratitis capitata TaxID=7213 RepID=W8APQ1_CERCA
MPSLTLRNSTATAISRRPLQSTTLTSTTQTSAGEQCRRDAHVAVDALRGMQNERTQPQQLQQQISKKSAQQQQPKQQPQQQCKRRKVHCNNNDNNHRITSLIRHCIPHIPRCNYKFLLNLLLCLTFLLHVAEHGLPTASAAINPRVPHRKTPTEPGVCRSIDVRNDCSAFEQLNNCTVIRGFLLVVLVPSQQDEPPCDYDKYTFPLLREITDFLIIHNVRGLRTVRQLFPNLAVIRGRRLFLNYALGITLMYDLEVLEFPALIAIQRGHIFVNTSPKLCNVDKIDFDRITLTPGENSVSLMSEDDCPNKTVCSNCLTDHCWSNDVCQRFENDNLVDPHRGIYHCHNQCLGGCYNNSNTGCYVCQNIEDHGACVKECPQGKYLLEVYQQCYTEEECKNQNMTVKDNKCVMECPENTIFDINGREVLSCIPCGLERSNYIYTIFNLGDAYRLRGCKVLNSSLIISLYTTVNEDDLARSLGNLRYIGGFLKIMGCQGLTSLKFLSGLQKIANNPELLDAGVYGLVIYNNDNLKDLWQPQENFEIVHGSMFVHTNKKLCNRKLREFQRKAKHDKSKDTIQVNDQEVLCEPAKLTLNIEVLTHHSIKLSWPKDQTSSEVEIMYRPIGANEEFVEHSELDTHICNRAKWSRILTFPKELSSNETYYTHILVDLKPNTRYALLVKTFGLADIYDARSEVKYMSTRVDLPLPPIVNITRKTDVSIFLKIQSPSEEEITRFMVEVYEHPDSDNLLLHRDYCLEPSYVYHEGETLQSDEDQDTCCTRKEEEADDWRFSQNMRTLFECNLDNKKNCPPDTNIAETVPGTSMPFLAIRRLTVDASVKGSAFLGRLERFRLYSLQVQACNEAGCGAYTFLWTRTNFSIGGDRLHTLKGCRVSGYNEFHINFPEPQHPNGLITSYVVHFRLKVPNAEKFETHIECMSQRQHVFNEQQMIAQLRKPFNEVAVRVYSLAGGFFTEWVPITICTFKESSVKISHITHKVPHKKGYAGMIVAICFIITFATILAWSCCKYDWREWRNFRLVRLVLGPVRDWQPLRADNAEEQIVEFRNIREADEEGEEGEHGERGEAEQLDVAAT